MPGIYTNVATFAPWIRNIIAGDRDSQATSTAASKPEIISSTWGIALLAGIACLCVLVAAGLVVAFGTYMVRALATVASVFKSGAPSKVYYLFPLWRRDIDSLTCRLIFPHCFIWS
jgi:hypothetical protein